MHLLLVDKNSKSARTLHGEFLDYRGVNWSLSHCADYCEAIELLEQESFQTLLLRTDATFDEAALAVNTLLQGGTCPPLVAVTSQLRQRERLSLIAGGSDDCCDRSESNGQTIMRALRMAETRKSTWQDQANEVAEDVLPGFSIDEFLADPGNALDGLDSLVVKGISAFPATSLDHRLRVAHLSHADPLVDQLQGNGDSPPLIRFSKLDALLAALEQGVRKFDALIVEQSTFEEANERDTAKLAHYLSVLPGLVLTLERSDYAALSYLEQGYSDCLVADRSSTSGLELAIRKAVIRRRRALLESLSQPQVGAAVNDRRCEVRTAAIRRRHIRFQYEATVTAIPMLPNHSPDLEAACDARATDVSLGGISLVIPNLGRLPRRNWIIGIEQENGQTGYASAWLRRVAYGTGEMTAGLIFENEDNDFLSEANLRPVVDAGAGKFTAKIPPAALDQWVELGVITKRLTRRVRCCPECDAVCSVGTGCCMCGGFDLQFHDLIHHFACAHVNHISEFEQQDSIQCPKCLSDHLVAGADFELIRSRYECSDCNFQGDATAHVGCCMNCDLRFPIEMAPEAEVYAHDVERMDILALVDTARHAALASPATDCV